MEYGIKEKIERWKIKAEVFLKNNTKAFIVDIDNNWYPCNIVSCYEDYIHVKCFEGKRKYENCRVYWSDVIRFEDYRRTGE